MIQLFLNVGDNSIRKEDKVKKTAISQSFEIVTIVISMSLLFSGVILAAGTYSGGTGDPNDPYIIADANDMQEVGANSDDWDDHFLMIADVNMADYTGPQFIIGYYNTWSDNEAFTGVFDGNGHTISNFTYESSSGFYKGLFGYVENNPVIKNLGLINPNVHYTGNLEGVGALVGGFSVTISDCYVKGGYVSGSSYVGGLIGKCYGANIYNCYSSANVLGKAYTGGLCGGAGYSTISNCYSSNTVAADSAVGGLVGLNYRSEINKCYSTSTVSGQEVIGGLVGTNGNDAKIYNCYSNCDVSGFNYVGGLVGRFVCDDCRDATITKSYSVSSISGLEDVGGLVGDGPSERVIDSFWDVDISEPTSDGGIGKTTMEMKQKSTFTNWDFTQNWGIEDNQTYPFLRLTYPTGDLDLSKDINFADLIIMAQHWLEDNNP
jgi:hypothetical protein